MSSHVDEPKRGQVASSRVPHLLLIAELLPFDECYDRLATGRVGRVVYSDGALPTITPARYAVSHPDIYFSTGPDDEQHRGIAGAVVAFEVEELDARTGTGWTVVATGIAEPCTHPSRWAHIASLGLLPTAESWHTVFRLTPGIIIGRCFTSAEPDGH